MRRVHLPVFMLACGAGFAHAADMTLLHADAGVVREIGSAASLAPADALNVELLAGGKLHRLELAPNRGLDDITTRTGGRARPFAGSVASLTGSWAAVTRIDGHWHGMWYDGGEYYGVETAGALASSSTVAAALPADQAVVFRLRDVVFDADALLGDMRIAAGRGAGMAVLHAAKLPLPAGRRLTVAAAADSGFVRVFGANSTAAVLAQLNIIDVLFTNQLGLSVSADSVDIFPDDGPFSSTGDASSLLGQVADWRSDSASHRNTGVTHLFTTRNLSGRIVGLAFVDSLCTRRFAASLSQSTAVVTTSALIAAHEIAHVLGAPHDGDAEGACPTTPADFLMAPRITGSQQFSACSVATIAQRVDAAQCLTPPLALEGLPPYEGRPVPLGGGGRLAPWHIALLGLMLAALRLGRRMRDGVTARTRAQARANQSAR